jgi:hypothetical protein
MAVTLTKREQNQEVFFLAIHISEDNEDNSQMKFRSLNIKPSPLRVNVLQR